MTEREAYSCPECAAKLPLRHIFLLNDNSVITCVRCGYASRPQKMGTGYLVATFLAVVLPGKISLLYRDSILQALTIGISCGLLAYGVVLVYVYKRIKFY